MRISDLEDMIHQQVTGNYICEDCHRLLTEHELIPAEPPGSIYVCCHPGNPDQRFKPPEEDVDYSVMADTLKIMHSMKVPDLESMIQQQVTGNYLCDGCHKPLTEHTLVPDQLPSCELYVCCYPDNPDQRFKPPKEGVDWAVLTTTLRAMFDNNQQDRSCQDRTYSITV